jgi:hypothetical protein
MKKVFAVFVFVALLGGGFASAQETTGAVSGTITRGRRDHARRDRDASPIRPPAERTTVTHRRRVPLVGAAGWHRAAGNLDGFQTARPNVESAGPSRTTSR